MKYYVYVYFANGVPFYVGKGSRQRCYDHLTKSHNPYLRRKIAKVKRNRIEMTVERVKFFMSEKQALKYEIYLIAEYRALGHKLCNLTDGGEGTSGYKHTAEERKRMSLSQKEISKNPEVLLKRGQAIKESHQRPEVKQKMTEASRKNNKKPEVRAKLSAANKISQNLPSVKSAKSKGLKQSINTRYNRLKRMKNNYFGVYPVVDRWRVIYKNKHIGYFDKELEAARAYNAVALPDYRNRLDNLPVEIDRRKK